MDAGAGSIEQTPRFASAFSGTWASREREEVEQVGLVGGISGMLSASVRRAGAYLTAGLREPGPERDDLVLLAKAALAATASWCLARWLLPDAVLSFAPLTALLVSQATLYRSLRHGAQYVVALVIGAGLAAGLAS
ncbi:hypothetical protein [Streptomyces sp. NPDC086787]|uniref:hypothetical protein n=1 Tax=Streptomyces sp. NPDC086787 TaxID=3365759 RepID=UPI00381B87E5